MLKKVIKIGCIIIGIFTLLLVVKGAVQISSSIDTLKDAVYLDSPKVLPQNEGKQIIISGKVEMTKEAYDDEFGIVLYTPVANRKYEIDKGTGTEFNWTVNETKTFFGEAKLGEFNIDKSILKLFIKLDDYSDFYHDDIVQYKTEHNADGFYLYESQDTRFSYSHCNLEENGEMTLVGIQKGDTIISEDAIISVYEGILPLERVRQEAQSTGIMGLLLGFAFGLGLIVYGLSDILLRKRKVDKNG